MNMKAITTSVQKYSLGFVSADRKCFAKSVGSVYIGDGGLECLPDLLF